MVFANLSVEDNLELGRLPPQGSRWLRADGDMVFQLFPRLLERKKATLRSSPAASKQMLAYRPALMSGRACCCWTNLARHRTALVARHLQNIVEINRRGTTVLLVGRMRTWRCPSPSAGYVLETGRVLLEDTAANLAANDEVRARIWRVGARPALRGAARAPASVGVAEGRGAAGRSA